MPFSDWLLDFPHFLLFASWKLLELLYIGSEHKMRRVVSSTSVQDLNRAAPATFRTQIEQIRTHFEQSKKRFETKWKIWTPFEPQLKKFKFLLKIKNISKKFKYQASHVLTKTFKTTPLSGDSNLVTQSLLRSESRNTHPPRTTRCKNATITRTALCRLTLLAGVKDPQLWIVLPRHKNCIHIILKIKLHGTSMSEQKWKSATPANFVWTVNQTNFTICSLDARP